MTNKLTISGLKATVSWILSAVVFNITESISYDYVYNMMTT